MVLAVGLVRIYTGYTNKFGHLPETQRGGVVPPPQLVSMEFARVKDDGRAEATLIALYAAEKLI